MTFSLLAYKVTVTGSLSDKHHRILSRCPNFYTKQILSPMTSTYNHPHTNHNSTKCLFLQGSNTYRTKHHHGTIPRDPCCHPQLERCTMGSARAIRKKDFTLSICSTAANVIEITSHCYHILTKILTCSIPVGPILPLKAWQRPLVERR
jgi:hypothetical protein